MIQCFDLIPIPFFIHLHWSSSVFLLDAILSGPPTFLRAPCVLCFGLVSTNFVMFFPTKTIHLKSFGFQWTIKIMLEKTKKTKTLKLNIHFKKGINLLFHFLPSLFWMILRSHHPVSSTVTPFSPPLCLIGRHDSQHLMTRDPLEDHTS